MSRRSRWGCKLSSGLSRSETLLLPARNISEKDQESI
jgi:hypothetical protein